MKDILHIIRFQLMYMLRPHCKMRDKFLTSMPENLKKAGIGGELENEMLARIIKSCNSMPELQREELLGPCLGIINYMIKRDQIRK